MKSKTPVPEKSEKELEPLILDGIAQILDNGHNMSRNFKLSPLTPKEKAFIVTILYEELKDPNIPGGLVYLYGHILDWIKKNTVYN